jgi:hypothetical protein
VHNRDLGHGESTRDQQIGAAVLDPPAGELGPPANRRLTASSVAAIALAR